MSTHIIDATEKALKKTLTLKDGMSAAADLIGAAEPLAASGIGYDSQPALKLRKAENRLRKAYSEVEMAARDLASSIHYATEGHNEAKASQGDLFDEEEAEAEEAVEREQDSATENELNEASAAVPMLPPAPLLPPASSTVTGDGAAADIEDAQFEDVTDQHESAEEPAHDLCDVDLSLAAKMEQLPATGEAFGMCLREANAPTLVYLLTIVLGTKGNKRRIKRLEKALADQPDWNTVALALQCRRLWAIEQLRAQYATENGEPAIFATTSTVLIQGVKETIATLETLRTQMLKLGEFGYEVSDERVRTNDAIRTLRTAIPDEDPPEQAPEDRADVDAMQQHFMERLNELEEQATWAGVNEFPLIQERLVCLKRDYNHWLDNDAPGLTQGQYETNLNLSRIMSAFDKRFFGVSEAG